MGFGDFQLNNNGKKEVLQNAQNGVRKEQVDKKFHNLFDAYDANNDGCLEKAELDTIFSHLAGFAGDDKVLDTAKNEQINSQIKEKMNIENPDFMGFIKSVSTASTDIIESKEKQTSDGGKEVTTTYKDGTTETIAYYSNGDYKWKKTEKRTLETSYEIIINGQKKQLNEAEFKKAVAILEKKDAAQKGNKLYEGGKVRSEWIPEDVRINKNFNEKYSKKQTYSPRYIVSNLGLDGTEEGEKIIERLSMLPEEVLEKLGTGHELQNALLQHHLSPSFDSVSTILEFTEGITLRNEEEYKATEAQRQEILTQIKAANFMANVYETLASYNDQYTDSVGLFGLGSEGIGYVLNKLGLDGENHYQFADSCREWAKNASELNVLNPEEFKKGFKKIYGENADKWGIDYNSDAFKKCFALAESGKAYDKDNKMTDEYKDAILQAMNIVVDDPNDSTFNQVMNGLGEALIMIATLGWGAETKAGTTLATTTMSTFSKAGVAIASKQANNKLLQGALRLSGQAVKLVGPALNEGTKMYLYTAAEGTLANVSNRAVKQDGFDKLLDTQAQVMTNADGSFTFGAFAGVFGSTVTQKVMQRASKVASKVTTTLSEKFSQGAVSANEVFATILEKSAPTKIAEAAAFATDVIGFTAFESALSVANTLQREGTLSSEKLADTLMEEFGHQGYSLGQIKVISHLIMMLTGSRSARMQSQKYLQENLPQLKGATVEGVNGGKEGFKINLPDGKRIECKNASEMITSLQLMVRNETAFSSKFDDVNKAKYEAQKNNYLREVDKYTRDAKINQANYEPGKSGLVAKKALSQPKVQQNVTRYLDNLLESNSEILKNSKSNGEIKPDVDYILPDGTVVSLKMNSAGEMFWNEKTQKYDVNFNSNPEIILWIKDTKGEEHIIPSFSEGNKARAQKILDYMSTLTAVPREEIAEAQKAAIAGRQDLNNQKNAVLEHPTATFGNTPALDECQMNRQSYLGMLKLSRKSDVQNEVSKCFDTLLEQVPKEFKYSETDSRPKRETDVMLPDGTVLSRGSLPSFAKNGEILIYCRNSDGSKEYFLVATTPQDITKAQRIYDYMSQLPIVERAIISDVQNDIKNGIPFEQAIKNRTEILNKKTEIEKENAHKKHINELLSLGSNSPTEIKFVTMDSPEIANITLSLKEKINAKVKNQKLEEVLNKKKIDTMYSRNAAFGEVADNISAHLTNLFYRLSTELNLDPMKEYAYNKEMPYDTPIELPDGTKIIREKVVKDDNFKHEPNDIISYITPNDKKYSLQCFSALNAGYARNIEDMMLQAFEMQNKTKLPYVKPETKVDLTPEAKAQVKDAVQNIRNDYRASFDQIKADLKTMGLDDIGNMSIRLKSEQSLYDKIANYMLEHKGATLEDAIKDVRDAIGARTVVESGKFANHPEVKALLDAGKEHEAMLRAAELQSEPAVESLKSEILKQEQNNNHLVTARISNYVSPDGIPYLSENQLADLKQFAANHGVKLKINLRIDPSDPNFSKVDENYKPTTKSQPSGYTALQVNFITKDGKTIEWQFRGDKVNEFAEGEHIPYDLRTGKNIIGEYKELEELYNPFIDMLSEKNMNKETYKEYNRYLSDYYTHLRKLELGFDSVEPKLEDYGKGFKFDERLSAKNLIALHETAEKIKKKTLSVKDAMNEYNSKININRIEKFASSVQPYTDFVVKNQEKIKELNKIQDMEEFCKQSFELIKNEMGLKDSGVKLAFAKGNEGGYYDLESNTVYVNKNWNGTKCVEGQGNKAEIFGDIAHELTHHIQWIEIMRNGWFEDDLGSAYKQQLLKSKEGKYIYNYASKIGSNDNSFETSMSQLWNWLNYKEPYKKGQNGFVSDRNGNPIVDENSSEYKEYINQPVEKDAFEKSEAVVKKYKELID